MIPTRTLDTTVQSNFTGKRIKFSMDEESLAEIGTVLRELYGDIEESFCRELITNAIDSHVQAGVAKPIQVTTPTNLSPYVVFKDEGVGLSMDDMEDIYTKYGKSTKRTSNAVTGSLGLGSKSPLAYTPSFTVVSVKDGVKILASVSLDEDEVPNMDIVDTVGTDEPNGVEIRIPAKRGNEFRTKIVRIARFMEPGKMLVDGKDLSLIPRLTKITERIYTYDGEDYSDTDYVVMGGVSYPANLNSGMRDRTKVVAFVEMGAVNFTPSRERLKDTERTRAVLKSLNQELHENLLKRVNEEIANASSPAEAMLLFRNWRNRVDYTLRPRVVDTYKGMKIPDGYVLDANNAAVRVINWRVMQSRHAVDSSSALSYSTFNTSVNIVNYPYSGTISSRNKAKIKKFFADAGIVVGYHGATNVLLFSGSKIPGEPWVTGLTAYDWNDIAKVKLTVPAQRTYTGYSRGGKYDVFSTDGNTFSLEDVTPADDVIYFSPTEYCPGLGKWMEHRWVIAAVAEMFPDHKVVSVAKGRQDKMKRNVKSHTHLSSAYDSAASMAIAKVTEGDKLVAARRRLSLPYSLQDKSDSFIARVEDPSLRDAMRAKRQPQPASIDRLTSFRYNEVVRKLEREILDTKVPNPASDYPLLEDISYYRGVRVDEEVLIYINAKFNSMKGNNP